MRVAYYNEIDPDAAAILRQLISDGVIAAGDVDTRSITEVQPDDLRPYTQCHFFAGGGLWSVAARLAGWPDDRPLWTGSCPCQPFSVAGKGAGADDPRHLWPDFFRLIGARRPAVVVGEQVAGKAGYGWLDGVRADLAGEGYAGRGVDIPSCAVDAPHIRQRLYWVALADANRGGRAGRSEDAQRSAVGRATAQWADDVEHAAGNRWAKGGPNMSFGAGGQPLPAQMHQASPRVTPSARDWKDTPGMATIRPDGRSRIDQLPRQMAATWVTPQAMDGNKGSMPPRPHDTGISLPQHMAATEAGGPTTNGSSATTGKRGAPNPAFPCWLMGFPGEWVSGAWRAMQSIRSSRRKSSAP